MACKKETVPFSGTPEQEAALKKVIAELKDTQGALMPIMQQAQDIYGYLPIEVQTMISDETGIPLEKIYGVSTFYSQFALQPKGKYQISVCLGTACYVKGSGAIFSKLEERMQTTKFMRHHVAMSAESSDETNVARRCRTHPLCQQVCIFCQLLEKCHRYERRSRPSESIGH